MFDIIDFCWNVKEEIPMNDKFFDFKKLRVRDFKFGESEEYFVPKKILCLKDVISEWIDPFDERWSMDVLHMFCHCEIDKIYLGSFELTFIFKVFIYDEENDTYTENDDIDDIDKYKISVFLEENNTKILKDFQRRMKIKDRKLKSKQ